MSETAAADYAPPVPDAVRRAAERANDLARQHRDALDGGTENTTVVDEPAAQETEAPQTETPAPPSQAETPTPPPPQVDTTNWQQRYNTLQGKYNSELPMLQGQVRALEGQLQQTQNLLATLRNAPPPAAAPARKAAEIPPEDVESYGEDLVVAARRWARAEIAPELDQLRQEVTQLGARSQQTATTLQQRTVDDTLDAQVPAWRTINDDPQFLQWLAQIDPFSQRRRHDMLVEAYAAGNAPQTSAFFRAFQNEQTAVTPPPGNQFTHTPNGAGQVALEDLAAPGRGNSTPASQGAPTKRMWSQDQIAVFYRDVTKGRYDEAPADKARIERDIYAAMSEGRIR